QPLREPGQPCLEQLVLGHGAGRSRAAALRRQPVDEAPGRAADLLRLQLDQVPRERGLGDLDALRGQQLRELRLGGDLLVREQLDDPLLARGLGLGEGAARIAHRRSPAGRAWAAVDSSGWSSSQVSRAFWACRRFSASSQTTEAGPSMTSAATSLPR